MLFLKPFGSVLAYFVMGGLIAGAVSSSAATPVTQPSIDDALIYVVLQNDTIKQWRLTGEVGRVTEEDAPHESTAVLPTVPLGSLWKLFVFTYLAERRVVASDYTCQGQDAEEVYCCQPGHRVGRDLALVKSCGRFFEPKRLGLQPDEWKSFWQEAGAPSWLHDLRSMRADFEVTIPDLLAALKSVPPKGRQIAKQVLLSVLTVGRGEGTVASFGGLLRGKTWTMPDPLRTGASIGGAAGWLVDDTPFWLGSRGSSHHVLHTAAQRALALIARTPVPDGGACVVVDFFDRYPIIDVRDVNGKSVAMGRLRGRYNVLFANGNSFRIESQGELTVSHQGKFFRIVGHFGVNDYVARVVEREGELSEPEAAKALAILARSYLVQRAEQSEGCFHIADSSSKQRVLARPASSAAHHAADFTDSLILVDANVQYHGGVSSPGRMGWLTAKASAARGESFDMILSHTWPQASLSSFESVIDGDCKVVELAQKWLSAQMTSWDIALSQEDGYEAQPLPAVCLSDRSRPYSDTLRHRIYIGRFLSEDDRTAVTHEYLHLAFANHPRGHDEKWIEKMARQLIRGESL